jgi:hypothetical protein
VTAPHENHPGHITAESIRSGYHREVARFSNGRRAYLIVWCPDERVALVTAVIDDDEYLVRTIYSSRFSPKRLADLERAVATARSALESTAA